MRETAPSTESQVSEPAERRLEPTDLLIAVTVVGALSGTSARAWTAALFFIATLLTLLALRLLALPRTFEFAASLAIVLTGWGNALSLFETVAPYDKAVHFLTPMLLAPCAFVLLVRSGALQPGLSRGSRTGAVGIFVVVAAIGFALAGVWEIIEGSTDRWLGTNLAFGYGETIDDLYSSLLGSLAGGILLAWSEVFGESASRTLETGTEAFDEGA